MTESTFKILLIPCDQSVDFQVIELQKDIKWLDRVREIVDATQITYVWPKVNEKVMKGGCLLIDALWYQTDKKNHKNDRATALFNRDLFGDIVLADVWYCDADEYGNPLDHPYDVFENVDVKYYNNLLHRVQTGQKSSQNVLYDIKKSFQRHGFEEIPETFVQSQWKAVTPKSLLFEYYQSHGWSIPVFQKVSTNPHGPHKVTVRIEPLNKSFTPEQGSKTVRESEHNVSLLALKFLMEQQVNVEEPAEEEEESPAIEELTVEDSIEDTTDNSMNSEFTHFTATKLKYAMDANPESKMDEQSAHTIVNVDLPTTSIVSDGGILKQVLKAADDNAVSPSPKHLVSIHYDSYLSDGKIHDTTRRNGVPQTFKFRKGAVLPAIDIAVGTMRVGEVARFVCSSNYCYGELGVPNSVPPNAAIIYEIELVHAESPETTSREIMKSLPASQRLQQSTSLKDEGNKFFKTENLRAALKSYSKALDLVTYSMDNFTEEEKLQASALKVNLHLNCAAVHLKNCKWEKAVFHSSQSLDLESNNTKGLLRRAKGYRNLNQLELCKADLQAVLALNPKDKDALTEWKLFQEREKQWREVERNMFSKMLQQNKPDQVV